MISLLEGRRTRARSARIVGYGTRVWRSHAEPAGRERAPILADADPGPRSRRRAARCRVTCVTLIYHIVAL